MKIKLTELLHAIDEEKESGLVNIEEWRWPDVSHLADMGFQLMDDHHMQTKTTPKITICKKKEKDPETGKMRAFFFIEEPKKKLKRFKTFNDVIEFFDSYKQPELDEKM